MAQKVVGVRGMHWEQVVVVVVVDVLGKERVKENKRKPKNCMASPNCLQVLKPWTVLCAGFLNIRGKLAKPIIRLL